MKQNGLTLIEVLIALAVLSIALTAIVRATALDIRNTNYLRDKTVALWVANNVMTQVQLGLMNDTSNHIDMLGQEWFWTADVTHTGNRYVDKLIISVSKKQNDNALILLSGFKKAT